MAGTHHIVLLDNWVSPPNVDFDHRVTQYKSTSPDQLPERIRDATIVVSSYTQVTRAGIEATRHLQLVACNSTGTNQVDKVALKERNIPLCHVPAQNTDSVSEHAFALYFALRRQIIPMHELTMADQAWSMGPAFQRFPRAPRTNSEETLVVIGYGAIGKKIESIGKALQMQVLIAERKGAESIRDGRMEFHQALTKGTIFMVVAPLDDESRNMIAASELGIIDDTALIINVGRGGTVSEHDLANALKGGKIGGAACDAFSEEPATRVNCPLLDPTIPNLILSPHVAWYSSRTIKGTIEVQKANLEAFVAGKAINVVL
ncbi:hypothetical protein LTR78_006102 [Recurvomyces mirabilis]|uniref:Glycerate dehydrogenase n=1 Tax=Recurvomyces mirabilis TaxID=574656 RepID=A0AAE1C0H8_9PEZI|nr:hypothetical protein LTR78_006102 [Recurvomyces mirabilis]KAK5151945.1 hypothetical protein LTS14_008719 [Recurvomyces mirabilis]